MTLYHIYACIKIIVHAVVKINIRNGFNNDVLLLGVIISLLVLDFISFRPTILE